MIFLKTPKLFAHLWHVVARIHSGSFRINPANLSLVETEKQSAAVLEIIVSKLGITKYFYKVNTERPPQGKCLRDLMSQRYNFEYLHAKKTSNPRCQIMNVHFKLIYKITY